MPPKHCRVCFHVAALEINQALAEGVKYSTITSRWGVSNSSIGNHVTKCLKKANAYDHKVLAKRAEGAFNFGSELMRQYRKVSKFIDALEKWLQDADDPTQLDIGPRDTEIYVTYLDYKDRTERGNPTRKKAQLSDLLERASARGTGVKVMAVQSTAFDNRKLYLDAFRTLYDKLEQIGKFEGHWKQNKDAGAQTADLDSLRGMISARAFEKGVPYAEELKLFLDKYAGDRLLPAVKTQLISELEQ